MLAFVRASFTRMWPVRTLLMTEKQLRPSTVDVLRNTKNLYRGFGVVAALTFPAHALYFIAYEESKRHLNDSESVIAHRASRRGVFMCHRRCLRI